jgi:SnoaL-like domain
MTSNFKSKSLSFDFSDREIKEIYKATISLYFTSLNAQNFEATASLFAKDGVLYPPFEEAIIGKDAIATYLQNEAKGMKFFPNDKIEQVDTSENVKYQVTGKVETPLFGVNVGWTFELNSHSEILAVEIKLLAKLEELLKLEPVAAKKR